MHTKTNAELLAKYRSLKSQINHCIEYIEYYEQQQDARKRNTSIYKEIDTLEQVLKSRSNGLCRVIGKYADIGDMHVHIIKKLTKDDEILIMYPNEIVTCEEFKDEDCFLIPRNKHGKIDWIPVELENEEDLYYEFGVETALNITRGWWFKFSECRTKCRIFNGDIFISDIKDLNEDKVNTIVKYCLDNRKRYDLI